MRIPSRGTRSATLVALIALVSSFVVVPMSASAAPAAPQGRSFAAVDGDPATLDFMEFYPEESYVDAAASVDAEFAAAIERDLGIPVTQYLAESDAAVDGAAVAESLAVNGVVVLGSRMEGTTLIVNVDSDADAALVESVGGVVEWGSPSTPVAGSALDYVDTPAGDVYNGQGYTSTTGSCSIGFFGYALTAGNPRQLVTAGHCEMGAPDVVQTFKQSVPLRDLNPATTLSGFENLGTQVAGTRLWGGGSDVRRISVTNPNAKPAVLTWGAGGSASPAPAAQRSVTGITAPIVGANVCRSGYRTGWSCGPITLVNQSANVAGNAVTAFVARLCVSPGDSGGSAVVGTMAVGIASFRRAPAGYAELACDANVFGGFFAMTGGTNTIKGQYGTTWEPAVSVSPPVITSPAGSFNVVSGTIANPNADTKVALYLSTTSTFPSTPFATVSAASGSWSVPIAGTAGTTYNVRVEGRWGVVSKSSQVTLSGAAKVIAVDRIAGDDRWATSAAVAQKFATATTVYVANGFNYPDALSAAPAAAQKNAPLLLTDPSTLPAVIAAQVDRLRPTRIVVVGGVGVVSAGVAAQLENLYGGTQVVRLAGADRYSTSRVVSQDAFPSNTTTKAFIATGANFPDALSASAAAGRIDGPVILVDGSTTSVNAPTAALLDDLGTTQVYIAGGTGVVSAGMQSSLDALPGIAVTRLGGTDRYSTSVAINTTAIYTAGANDAYLAVGTGFADALAGAALAGRQNAPLFVVPGTCIPAATLAQIKALNVKSVHLLGGVGALTANVFALRSC